MCIWGIFNFTGRVIYTIWKTTITWYWYAQNIASYLDASRAWSSWKREHRFGLKLDRVTEFQECLNYTFSRQPVIGFLPTSRIFFYEKNYSICTVKQNLLLLYGGTQLPPKPCGSSVSRSIRRPPSPRRRQNSYQVIGKVFSRGSGRSHQFLLLWHIDMASAPGVLQPVLYHLFSNQS